MRGPRLRWTIVLVSILAVVAAAVPASAALLPRGADQNPGQCRTPALDYKLLSNVTFHETGLPPGMLWSVVMDANGTSSVLFRNNSTAPAIHFAVPEGVYNFTIANESNTTTLFVPVPAQGCIDIKTSPDNVSLTIVFTATSLVELTFTETGLPGDIGWGVNVVGGPSVRWAIGGTNSSITLQIPTGKYHFAIANTTDTQTYYAPTPASGMVVVGKSPVTVDVSFVEIPAYPVGFSESGVPSGVFWCVGVGSVDGTSVAICQAASPIGFTLPDGTYNFTVQDVFNGSSRYASTPTQGNFTVDGGSVAIAVTFAWVPTYSATFVETGLANGTVWTVALTSPAIDNASVSGEIIGNTQVVDLLPNGTYSFTVWPPSGYTATPASGTIVIDGANVTVDLTFSD